MPDWCILLSFVAYLALMLGIGFLFSRRQEDLGDYYLGGRQMNKWVVALSAQASDMSGWLLMGLPGAVFVGGLSEAWIGVGLLVGTYLNWRIVARRLRVYSHVCNDSITIPDFVCNRFRDSTGLSRSVAAIIILVFFTFYTASGFVSCAKLFTSTFGVSYSLCLWIGAAVVVGYTLLGGYMAVCWTDFIQGSLMFLAIVLVPALVVCGAGGLGATADGLNAINPRLLSLFTNAETSQMVGAVGLASCMSWGLGYFGMPHILVRFMSIDDPSSVKGSRRIAMLWVTVSLVAAVLIGLVFHLYLRERNLTLADVGGDPEKVFMVMILGLFKDGFLMRLFAGVLLSAIMAAIMSTADSQLLVSASSFSNDLYRFCFRRNASDRELILVSRLAVALISLIAVAMAMNTQGEFFKVVMKMVAFAWAGFGAAFGPLILLSLFWRRTNLAGAVSGMVVGAVTCFVWKFALPNYASTYGIFGLYELAPGFVLSFLMTVVVSLATKRPSADVLAEFDRVSGDVVSCSLARGERMPVALSDDAIRIRAIVFAVLAALLYAVSTPVSKFLLQRISPTMLAGLLYLGAGLGLLLVRALFPLGKETGDAKKLRRGDMKFVVAMVVLDIAAPVLLLFGLGRTTAANVSLLNNFEIVMTSVIAFALFGERISRRLWIGIALVTLACLLLSVEDASSFSFSLGSLYVLAACLCWGLENNCTRRLSARNPMTVTIVKGFGSGIGALSISFAIGERLEAFLPAFGALGLGFVAYGLSIWFYICAQRHIGASRTSAYYALSPFIGAALSLVAFGELPTRLFWIALAIMVAGTIVVTQDSLKE